MKCDFCYHRVDNGGVPACVETCPTQARIFGEWDGGEKPLRELALEYEAKGLLPEKAQSRMYFILSKSLLPENLNNKWGIFNFLQRGKFMEF